MGVIRRSLLVAALLTLGAPHAWPEAALELSHAVAGSRFEYVVQDSDTLWGIESRFGEPAADIVQDNGIDRRLRVAPGQHLQLDALHIVPGTLQDGILINLPQRMLFFFRDGRLRGAYPVGLGKPTWQTPAGTFNVVELRKDPVWIVPPSIQAEMREEGHVVLTRVPPGPKNPLGKYWIGLSIPGYGIHATNAPRSVYRFGSHGCIRLHPDDAEALFQEVRMDEPGKLIYAPVLLAALDDGRILLEVNPDAYRKGGNPMKRVIELAGANGLGDRIDWEKAAQVIRRHEGIARQINLLPQDASARPDAAR